MATDNPWRCWRLCKRAYADTPLDGFGALRFGGRWNSPGRSVVYASSALSLAALELLVHFDHDTAPDDYVAVEIIVPGSVVVETLDATKLPKSWRAYPAPQSLAAMGDAWLGSGQSALLRVPSAVVPTEHNWLINPSHPDARKLSVEVGAFAFDPRLL